MLLHEDSIEDQSQAILEGCEGSGQGFLDSVEEYLRKADVSGINWSRESGSPSFLKSLGGKRRDFLVIRCTRFPEHVVCIHARDFGNHLDVSWFLLVRPRIRKRLWRAFRLFQSPDTRSAVGSELDTFDLQDLQAFVALTRSALETAIQSVLQDQKRAQERFVSFGAK